MVNVDLIGSAEACVILGVPRTTFNRWAAAGTIPAVASAPGSKGARLFDRSVIERIAAERQAVAS